MENKVLKIIGLVVFTINALSLTSCAKLFPDYQGNYIKTVQSWEGSPESSLYKVWGYADQTQTLDTGNTLLTYNQKWEGTTPTTVTHTKTGSKNSSSHSSTQTISTGGSYSFSCKTQFEVNAKQIIVNTAVRGFDCGWNNNATQDFIDSHSTKPFKSGTCYWNCF